jgi:hypothetical protein
MTSRFSRLDTMIPFFRFIISLLTDAIMQPCRWLACPDTLCYPPHRQEQHLHVVLWGCKVRHPGVSALISGSGHGVGRGY